MFRTFLCTVISLPDEIPQIPSLNTFNSSVNVHGRTSILILFFYEQHTVWLTPEITYRIQIIKNTYYGWMSMENPAAAFLLACGI